MQKIIIGLSVLVVVGAIVYFAMKRGEPTVEPTLSATPEASLSATVSPSASAVPTKLTIETLVAGTGVGAKTGDTLSMKYKGMLVDGRVFDSNVDKSATFDFKLGAGTVIKGWEQGLVGIKVGEKRRLIIPPDLGYGANGAPGSIIGPNATLIFEVEAIKIIAK